MKKTFGERASFKPEGMLREIHWPSLATMDRWTGDGRRLLSTGANTRTLPRTFAFQFASGGGHEGAVPVGRVDQVVFGDDGNIEGWGWLLDSEDGRNAALLIASGVQRHNSIELAEVKADIDVDWDTMEIKVDFTEWAFAGTVGVARPAFADATIELTDEMTAAIYTRTEPLECVIDSFDIHLDLKVPELTASAASTVPWADFHIPESEHPHKIVVDEEGRVFGHLAVWGEAHRGYTDQFRTAPRPLQAYTEFNHSGPLTEKGPVGTGPVFAVGGHPRTSMRGKTREQIHDAYGGIENGWADVRVTEGVHGPWISGRIRPGLSDEQIYAARASHLSGHWVGGDLVAIVSCNVPGFLPGAGFAAVSDGEIVELVASFPAEMGELVTQEALFSVEDLTEAFTNALARTFNSTPTTASLDIPAAAPIADEMNRRRLAVELDLDDG